MEVVAKCLIGAMIMRKTNYKILFADLDGTLITTASGKTFPEGIWDMKLRFDVLDVIKKLSPEFVCIVTNQGGIARGYGTGQLFDIKVLYIQACIQEYCGVTARYAYCSSMSKQDPRRKPNPGMLEELLSGPITGQSLAEKEECLMIGDASGKSGQWSDTDKRTAENFGIDYLDVEDFVKEMSNERTGIH